MKLGFTSLPHAQGASGYKNITNLLDHKKLFIHVKHIFSALAGDLHYNDIEYVFYLKCVWLSDAVGTVSRRTWIASIKNLKY